MAVSMESETDKLDHNEGSIGDSKGASSLKAATRNRLVTARVIRISAVAVFGISYWLLYAAANDMIFYYRTSVYPFLAATNTPNPYFFLRTGSLLNLYESGVEWFPTGHIGLVFLAGDTFFSVIISLMVVRNSLYIYDSIRAGMLHRDFVPVKFFSLIVILFTVLMCLAPLDVLAVIALRSYFSVASLEIWVSSYRYFDNIIDAILLGLLILLWRRIMHFLPS